MKYKTLGNCPYCDAEINNGISSGWSGSQEMFDAFKYRHDINHPENDEKLKCPHCGENL